MESLIKLSGLVFALIVIHVFAFATHAFAFGPDWQVKSHSVRQFFSEDLGTVDVWVLERVSGDGAPVTFVLAVFSSKTSTVVLEHVDRKGQTSEVYSVGVCNGAVALANASFFVTEENVSRPLGLLRIDGRTITPVSKRKSGGFLAIDANGLVKVLPRNLDAQVDAAHDIVESTPIIILHGLNDMRGNQGDMFDRVGVGNTQTGASVLVGAFAEDQQTVSLWEFTELTLAAGVDKGIMLDSVLAMDGGPSAHLWFPQDGVLYGHRGPVYLPSAVCVNPR